MRRALPLVGLLLGACAAPLQPPVPAGLDALDAPVREQYEARAAAVAAQPDEGDSWGELGLWFDAYEQWDAAAACHGRAAELSGAARWHEQLAHAERLRGRAAKARLSFERVLELEPRAVPSRVWLAELSLADGDLALAERRLREALDLAPGHVRARAGLARVALEKGETRLAIELAELALADQPDSGALQHLLGRALRDAGEEERASRHLAFAAGQGAQLTPVAMDDPRRAEVAALRAGGRSEGRRAGPDLRAGRFDEALSRLEQALAANPEDATASLNLARAQARLGDPARAIATLDRLLAREPGHARALEVRGLAQSLAGNEDAAVADFREALRSDPDAIGARRQLARLLWTRGDFADALPHWERVADLEPGDAQARYRRAEAAGHAERWSEAVAWLTLDVEELPQPEAFRQLLARTLSVAPPADRDAGRALALALADHERAPRLRQAETVALAHAGAGDFESAIRWQAAALAAVEEAGRGERHAWVAARLAQFEARTQEPRPFRQGEGRGSLPVEAP